MTAGFSRRIRRAGRSLLPAAGRAQLRAWYAAATAPRRGASASFSEEGGSVAMSVAGGPRLLVPRDCRDEFETHFRNPQYAAELAAFLRSARSPGRLFDVGANNGLFSLLYCGLHPSNLACGYEPSTTFADRAQTIVDLNGFGDRVRIVRSAVADDAGSRTLLLDGQTGRVQVMQFEGTKHHGWLNQKMETTTIDVEAARVGAPSAIKIDVEGHEWEVLLGATEVLTLARPVVFLELHLRFLEERGIEPSRVTDLLTERGYHLHDLAGRRMPAHRLTRTWASVMHIVASPGHS